MKNKEVKANNSDVIMNDNNALSENAQKIVIDSNLRDSEEDNIQKEDNEQKSFSCRAQDLISKVVDEDSFMKFVDQLEDRVLADIENQLYTFNPAIVGYDMYSDAVIYDYDMLMKILIANGYCAECADTFINSFAFWNTSAKKGQFIPDNIVLVKKEQAEVNAMEAAYVKRQQKKTSKRSKKADKAKK